MLDHPSQSPPRKVHLIGICGAGMKALAEVLHDRGEIVGGCDHDPDPAVVESLRKQGIDVQVGHAAGHIHPGLDLVISSAAVQPENLERQAARTLDIPQQSYVQALAELSRSGQGVAIAGTHGKSTTTAMLGEILSSARRSPTVICGAESIGRDRNGWAGAGPHVIFEACEYRRHFLELSARLACVLGIEPDHFDCYPTLDAAADAYQQFVAQVPADGAIVFHSECPVIQQIIQKSSARKISFGLAGTEADWKAKEVQSRGSDMEFQIECPFGTIPRVRLRVPGVHNVLNALAAATCAGALGISLDEIAAGLASYRGLRRRLEYRGERNGARVIDDYAHHPTEIRAAISSMREAEPGRPVWCVFEPHQTSRTSTLMDEFVEALSLADRVFLLPVYAARETPSDVQAALSQELVTRLGGRATFIPTLDRVWASVQTDPDRAPVILTLGAGTLTRIHHEFT